MIYYNFEPAEVTANCGKHLPEWKWPVTESQELLQITMNGRAGYCWREYLMADGGLSEIEEAVKEAPELALSKGELSDALEQAG